MDQADIAQHLHPHFVMQSQGHYPVTEGWYFSPFTEDGDNPSFQVFWGDKQEKWRWNDHKDPSPQGQGDSVDLCHRFGVEPVAVLMEQARLGYEGPPAPEREPADLSDYDQAEGIDALRTALAEHLLEYSPDGSGVGAPAWFDIPLSTLFDEWRLRAHHREILFPFFAPEGELVGFKRRLPNKRKLHAGDGNHLFGVWRLEPDEPVILVEGETDTLSAQHFVGDDYRVLGVPGAGRRPESVGANLLAGRDVVLSFDPDTAGRAAVESWMDTLLGLGCHVRVVSLPEGKDVSECTAAEYASCLAAARTPSPVPPGFGVAGGVYATFNKDGEPYPVSSFTFVADRVLMKGQELAYEGLILPARRRVMLPSSSLLTKSAFVRWASENGVHWWGSDAVTQKLASLLSHETLGVPVGRYTEQLGLHDGVFVLPDSFVGSQYTVWDRLPTLEGGFENGLHLVDGDVDPIKVVFDLLDSYDIRVSGPLLAWLAAAPLRMKFEKFPQLFITGGRGSGKTETTRAMMYLFNGSSLGTSASSTIHVITQHLGANNAFPYFLDEYRANALHREQKKDLEDRLRLAYNGNSFTKGGVYAHGSKGYEHRLHAPIILGGEDDIKDEANRDRIIPLNFRRDMRNRLPNLDASPLGLDYLRFLSDEAGVVLRGGFIPVHPDTTPGPSDRQRWNLGVIRRGWLLLEEYLIARGWGGAFPHLDLSHVVGEFATDKNGSPLASAIRYLLNTGIANSVWEKDDEIMVMPGNFLEDVSRLNHIQLPYSAESRLIENLVDDFGAVGPVQRRSPSGGRPRVYIIPSDVVQ